MKDHSQFENIEAYLKKGAVILDVRTDEEYEAGHVKNAVHIVLDELESEIDEIIKLQKPVITCCRSGARSERAKDILLAYDIDAINGGPWENVDSYL